MTERTKKLLFSLYFAIILAFSLAMISSKIPLHKRWLLFVRLDYLSHVLLFIPWMLLVFWVWHKKVGMICFFLASVAGIILAIISECSQYFVPYRSFDVSDLITNCLGIVIGGVISWAIFRKKA